MTLRAWVRGVTITAENKPGGGGLQRPIMTHTEAPCNETGSRARVARGIILEKGWLVARYGTRWAARMCNLHNALPGHPYVAKGARPAAEF